MSKEIEDMVKEDIARTKDSIKQLNEKLKSLEAELVRIRHLSFSNKYGVSCKSVLKEFAEIVDTCSYQGGEGYRIFTPFAAPHHHWVIKPERFKDCQPAQRDKDAYYAYMGYEMEIPTKTHVERWGN